MLLLAGAMVVGAAAQAAEPNAGAEPAVAFFIGQDEAGPGLKEFAVEGGQPARIFLHAEPVVTSEHIASTKVIQDDRGKPAIEFVMNEAGREKLAKATGEALPSDDGGYKLLAIVVKGKVVSAPRILSKIAGRAQLTGNFSQAEAEELVKNLGRKK
jgi:preprotein translocase subunit SecD